ncbi:hypothetical protein [Mycobacterium hubeiense]|uniref:hypothetical protein n=1 Tax=Mycobacterium hubeiense TaxID=1867256 RepID=UPI000C7EC1A7|nr:hypothetical protein [Mycobacterium sp. QGD 101]
MARAKRISKKAAEYQARADEALANRTALVGAIGAAEEKYEQQRDKVAEEQRILEERAAEVADAYNNALEGGWTATELKELGITRPDAKPSKSSKNSTPKSSTLNSDAASTATNSDAHEPSPPPERSPEPANQ